MDRYLNIADLKGIEGVEDYQLDFVKDQMKQLNIEDILKDSPNIAPMFNYLRHKYRFMTKYSYPSTDVVKQEDKQELENTIYTITNWFYDSLRFDDGKLLLAFFVVVSFLDIAVNDVIDKQKVDRGQAQTTIDRIKQLLDSFRISTSVLDGIPYREKELFDEYQDGINESNFEKIYNFMDAYDRSGRSYIPKIIRVAICTLLVLDEDALVSIISRKNSPLEIELFLRSLPEQEYTFLKKLTNADNLYLQFGMLRVFANRRVPLTDSELINVVEEILLRIAKINADSFNHAARVFSNSYVFYAGALKALPSLDKKFVQILCSNIVLSKSIYNNEIQVNNHLVDLAESYMPKTVLLVFSEQICNKYISYLDGLIQQGESSDDLILTSWFPFVIFYLKNYETPILASDKLKALLDEALYNNCRWYNNGIDAKTGFFVTFSKIYTFIIVLYCIRYRKDNRIIDGKLRALLDDKRVWLEYFDTTIQPVVIRNMYKFYYQTKILRLDIRTRRGWRRRGWRKLLKRI